MNNDFYTLNRQDLLFLKKDAPVHQGTNCTDAEKVLLAEWLSLERPVIIRRPGLTVDGSAVNCGIPLPPAQGKKRISFLAPLASIERKGKLPLLRDCIGINKNMKELIEVFEKNAFEAHVFGSLAWEYLTGLKYLQKSSDIDISFKVENSAELHKLDRLLSENHELLKSCDIEIILWNGDSFSRREFLNSSKDIMIKNTKEVFLVDKNILRKTDRNDREALAGKISYEACSALSEELETYPKPGLVSYFDRGSHQDMDATHFMKSISALKSYFRKTALAGMNESSMGNLRIIGVTAEREMLEATGNINTHRGAIFTLGLLAAAAGYKLRNGRPDTLGEIVKKLWGKEIMEPVHEEAVSHGRSVQERYGFRGAKEEAALGFPNIYNCGLDLFKVALEKHDRNTAKLLSFFAMLENVNDTTLLYRGGLKGLEFAKNAAAKINNAHKAGSDPWKKEALKLHRDFIRRRLSPGGVADLLSAVIFISRIEELCQD